MSTEAKFMNVQFDNFVEVSLGIILGVLRLDVSVYNVYISNQFQTTFAQGGKVKSVSRGDCEKQ